MKSFEFERWDAGRLSVNIEFAELFDEHGYTTFDAILHSRRGSIAKDLRSERVTSRFELADRRRGTQAFYIKRHGPPPWREYVKPLLRLTRPTLGARNEWNAMIRFHQVGIPTMVPVALGESGRFSFVISQAIEGYQKLSHWMRAHWNDHGDRWESDDRVRRLVQAVAQMTRTMHSAGMHHQDFYLTHLLIPEGDTKPDVHVIDLGRVRTRSRLSRRWIVKDLAQLHYSAQFLSPIDRWRFLRTYLGRNLQAEDRAFAGRIERKARAIARHSKKNRL